MRFDKYGSLFFILFDNIFKNLLSYLQRAERVCQNQDFVAFFIGFFYLLFQAGFIPYKGLDEDFLVLRRKFIRKRLPGLLDIFGAGMGNGGNVVDFHIQAVFAVAVLHKNKVQTVGHECLKPKHTSVVEPRRIKVFQAVQSVLHGVVGNFILI